MSLILDVQDYFITFHPGADGQGSLLAHGFHAVADHIHDQLADFIVNGLGVASWPGHYEARVAFHRSCHTRGTASGDAAVALLRSIRGLELLPFGEAEQCCGFGGTFSVTFPNTSEAMGLLKLGHVAAVEPDFLASLDLGCLMHLDGLARRNRRTMRPRHVAQILRDSLREAGLLQPAEVAP